MNCYFIFIFAESLDELEKIVVPLFGRVENKYNKRMEYSIIHHPWGPEELRNKIYILPFSDVHTLRLNFPVPDISHVYRTSVSFNR